MLTKKISEFVENLDIKNLEERFIPGKTFIPASAKKIDKTEIKLMVEASIESCQQLENLMINLKKN